jgi:hypothetical protein
LLHSLCRYSMKQRRLEASNSLSRKLRRVKFRRRRMFSRLSYKRVRPAERIEDLLV